MIVVENLNLNLKKSLLTIGMFDGVHLGHQSLFKKINEKKKDSPSCIITFKNHPHLILNKTKIKPIYDIDTKLKLLEKNKVDVVILLEFTKEFANLNYIDFIKTLKEKINFSHLILGENASFGKNREENKKNLLSLAKNLTFKLEYIPTIKYKNVTISSSLIRDLLIKKDYKTAQKLLGYEE